jgi:hypothetical protein
MEPFHHFMPLALGKSVDGKPMRLTLDDFKKAMGSSPVLRTATAGSMVEVDGLRGHPLQMGLYAYIWFGQSQETTFKGYFSSVVHLARAVLSGAPSEVIFSNESKFPHALCLHMLPSAEVGEAAHQFAHAVAETTVPATATADAPQTSAPAGEACVSED